MLFINCNILPMHFLWKELFYFIIKFNYLKIPIINCYQLLIFNEKIWNIKIY